MAAITFGDREVEVRVGEALASHHRANKFAPTLLSEEKTRQERREERQRKRRQRMRKHSKDLSRTYRDAILKRMRRDH